jgi:hypothetical protein
MAHGDGDGDADRVAGRRLDGERRPGLRAVGAVAARVAGPIVGRRGGGILARLKAEWRTISGDAVAARAWPDALSRDGTLRLRVASGAALEMQHRAPLLIERMNLFFGRGVVTRIMLVQGPLPLAAAASSAMLLGPDSPNPTVDTELAAQLADIDDPGLRAALASLGLLVRGRHET